MISYQEFQKAVQTLGLLSKSSKSAVRQKYLKLSKQYHPDVPTGDTQKFQEINDAYELICEYMDNFRFEFDTQEFQTQYPFSAASEGDWMYGGKSNR